MGRELAESMIEGAVASALNSEIDGFTDFLVPRLKAYHREQRPMVREVAMRIMSSRPAQLSKTERSYYEAWRRKVNRERARK